MIKITNLFQSYGDNKVLKDISLNIEDEKITALIGANGAGKSTLLGVIARLINYQSGDIYLDDVNMKDLKTSQIAQKLAILKQSNNISLKLSVKDLVTFGRFPHSKGRLTKECEAKIEEALVYMKVKDIENKYLDELSGGQRQRAFIAMILAQDTKYVLLDEPLNNLDMRYAVEMMTILQSLVKDLKKTVIVVLHDINIAAAFSDHIVAMKDGVIIDEGDADDMIDKQVLDHVFDHDFCIAGFGGRKVCIYYNQMGDVTQQLKVIEEK